MSLLNIVIIIEICFLAVVILLISKQKIRQNRQSSLSKKAIKNLKL